MLHLQACVHFHKVEVAVVRVQKLDGTGSLVANGTRQIAGSFVHAGTNIVTSLKAGRRALLDKLLVATLHRALALAERKHMTLFIGHNLYFDMMGRRDELFHVALAVAKDGLALGTRLDKGLRRVFHALDLANAASATARARLNKHGAANAFGLGSCLLGTLEQITTRHDRHARGGSSTARRVLVAHAIDDLGRRTHKYQAVLVAVAHEARLFGEKTVPRVDGLGPRLYGTGKYGVVVKVALGKTRTANAVRLVGKLHVQCLLVGCRIDGDGLDAHIATGANDAHRDLTAIGDEHFVEHRDFLNFRAQAQRTCRRGSRLRR